MSRLRSLPFAALAALFTSALNAQKLTAPDSARVGTQVKIEYLNAALAGQSVTITLISGPAGEPVEAQHSVTLDTEGRAKLEVVMPAGPVLKVNAPGATEATVLPE